MASASRIAAEAAAEASFKEAEAIKQLAEAERQKGLALAEAKRAMVEAENAVGDKLLLRDVATKALEVAPDLARELMLPAQKITEIKVLQANGLFPNGTGDAQSGAVGAMSPILKTLMEAGAAYPLIRELMAFGKVDGAQLGDKVQSMLGSLGGDLGKLVAESSTSKKPEVLAAEGEAAE